MKCTRFRTGAGQCLLIIILAPLAALAAEYRVMHVSGAIEPGSTLGMALEVETMAGDNLVDVGHFAFAIDLDLDGTAGATGNDISGVAINTADWDDVDSNQLGGPEPGAYTDIGGVTTDAFAPNFGANVGDVVALFTFDLLVPDTASPGDVITITPSEGFLQNLTVNDNFDPVAPQTFGAISLTVIPEPGTTALLLSGVVLFWSRRAQRRFGG